MAQNGTTTLAGAGISKLVEIEKELGWYAEREDVAHTMIVALLTRQHHLQIGPPGTAKSHMIRAIVRAIVGVNYFEKLVGKALAVDELLGPTSLNGIKEDDFRRVVENFMPWAHIVFLDELYRAGDVLIDPTLSILNERVFTNGRTVIDCPLISLFSGTNMLYEGPALDAFDSRIVFRVMVDYVREEQSVDQLIDCADLDDGAGPSTEKIGLTLEELEAAQEMVKDVEFPPDARMILKKIRQEFRNESIGFDDRKLIWLVTILKAEALLNGRTSVESEDFTILEHVLWRKPEEQRKVSAMVLRVSNPWLEEARKHLDDVTTSVTEARSRIREAKRANDYTTAQEIGNDCSARIVEIIETLERRVGETQGKAHDAFAAALSKIQDVDVEISREFLKLRVTKRVS